MAHAVNGTGELIKETQGVTADVLRAKDGLLSLLAKADGDRPWFGRNSDRQSPLAAITAILALEELVNSGKTERLRHQLKVASDEHKDQGTNLEQTYFGQYRKKVAGSDVPRTEKLDPMKFAAKFAADSSPNWTGEDIANYKKRGQETPQGFKNWPRDEKIRWLLGRDVTPPPTDGHSSDIPQTERKSGRRATDEKIKAARWEDHWQAVIMSVRSDFGGKDKVQKMMKKLGFQDGMDGKGLAATEEALRQMEIYRSKLQNNVSSQRTRVLRGPGVDACHALLDIIRDMREQPTEKDVLLFRQRWPLFSRAADHLLEEMERMREGSVTRMSRRIDEMRERCIRENRQTPQQASV